MAVILVSWCVGLCGSVGGVGGGGIFVPVLNLIIGFDPKSSVALSKCTWNKPLFYGYNLGCSRQSYAYSHSRFNTHAWAGMITGTAVATVVYNLRQRHPTLDMPVIDYDLALLFQPMLVLGISIGVAFNVILSTGTNFPFVCTTLLWKTFGPMVEC